MTGQLYVNQGQVLGVGVGVRRVGHLVEGGRPFGVRPPPVQMGADLSCGDRGQPGPEALRGAQRAQLGKCPQHRLLHHVVDVRKLTQCPAYDRVHERQVRRGQVVERSWIAGLCGDDQARLVDPAGSHHESVHGAAGGAAQVPRTSPPSGSHARSTRA